ncbi:inorganic phosphate cotransporter [Asbolus verrucosus]|uniref:Putative inorganic phosphate cotransporter n=1 Tax=Asbolus verrucosus TaxID=1661398 RepID=A0A482V8Y5_ASBVE|nr:inorganic phosphate cotransporter [Asbolus verrucosus]
MRCGQGHGRLCNKYVNPHIDVFAETCFGVRHVQVLLNFLLTFIAYGIRVNLSVGIVAMTTESSSNPTVPVYKDWHDKSIVLSSFFWGYIIPQIGAGQLAKKFGPKWFLVGTMSVCSFFSLALPLMAETMGSRGVMASRALQGFCQGFIFPSIHNLLSHWVPIRERSRLGTFVYAGGSLGTVVSMIVTGLISASWQGWPMVFYVYGGIGLIWAVAMAILGSNKPSESKTISEKEKNYIESSLGNGDNKKPLPTPWKEIMTSLPVWAILIAHCGQNWGFWTLMTEIPLYMSHVMNFQIKSNSYLSALPYFILWILSFIFSAIADYLIIRKCATIGATRKIFNSIGLIIPAVALVFLGFMNEEYKNLAILLLIIAVSMNSAIYSGYNVNHMDISPNHSGTLMGITNCISNIFSLLAPLFVQIVVTDEKDTTQWQTVFYVASIIYVVSDIFFVVYGSGEVQEWNDEISTKENDEKYTVTKEEEFFFLFLASVVAYGVRTNMSVGIIAMMSDNPPDPSISTYPEWTEKETILSSFFWGYVIPQISAGQLVKKFGPKWFLAATMFINSLFTLLIPLMAEEAGEVGVIACRVIQGLNQGFLYPSVHNLISKWTPAAERSQVASFVYAGGPLGTVIALPVTGVISSSSVGWPVAFYLYGGLGIGWSILWGLMGADSPAKHGGISDEEKQYIEGGIVSEEEKKELPTPWTSIFTSMPFIAILVAHCGQNWGFWTLLTEIPSYMDNIMEYNIKDNSLLSALPYFVLWILSFLFSPLADFLINRQYLATAAVRKIYTTVGLTIPAIALLCLSFVDSGQKDLAMVLLVIAVGFNAAIFSGFLVNHIDLSPNHAGILMGITNTVSNVFSIVAPLIVKVIPYEETDPVLWRYVFCIAAGIYVVASIVYIIYASGEIQSWNEDQLLGLRHVQFFLLFLSTIMAYGVRTNMSVGIIAMMSDDPPDPSIPTYPEWTQKEIILSAFFWGYVIPQIGAGQIAKKFGPKWFLAVTMFLNSLFTLLIPVMAINVGQGGVIACRIIQGLNQGFLFPSIHNLLGKWTPLQERSKIASFVYTGGPLGTVIALPITGVIANSSVGWPVAFYLYGGLGIGWSVLWSFIGADSPEKHGRISEEERRYIEGDAVNEEKKTLPTPWLSIFTSMPFIAILVTHCGQNWGFWTLLTEIPSYMEKIMKYDIKDNSLLSALPYFILWILSFFFSPLADFLIVRRYLSIGNVRKIFNSVGLMIPAIALVCLGFVDSEQKDLALALLVIAVGFNAAIFSGFNVNHIDLSPNHAGILMGITNSLSNIFSIIAPLAIEVIPYEQTDPILWRYVFCIAAGIYVVTDLFYVFFASGEVQPWNEDLEEKLIGVRHFQFVLMFLTLLIFFGIRTSLSVAIISMTEDTPPDPSIPTYPDWDNTDIILSSFFWGYIIPQTGAGQLSEYFGPKWFLVATMTIGSIFHVIIPSMAASLGSSGVIICRVVQGLNQAFLYPSLHNLISRWTPLYERSKMSNFVYGGSSLGIAISMPVIGAICGSKLGWPAAFYLYGGLGLGWSLVFAIFAENSPSTHKSVSEEERIYIQSSNSVTHNIAKKVPTPWRSIITSLPVWGILFAGCSQCWGAFTLLTEIPSYMSNIMGFDISDNSQLSALPYIAQFLMGLITAPISDRLITNKVATITTMRKCFNSLGTFIPATALIALAFVDSSQRDLATGLLIVAVGSTACTQSGYLVNLIDVAPNHAGTLLGMVNGTNNIFSILGPLTVGLLGSDKKDPVLWRKVFLLTAGIYIAGGVFYDLFTSGEVQPWNNIEEQKTEKEKLIGVRHFQFAIIFFTVLIFFVIRTSLSVAIISMTEETPPDPSIPTYPEWDNTDVILSSFFWGYIVPQAGAGQLSEYFGPKWFLVLTTAICSIFHIIVPSMAGSLGSTGVMVCRVIQGLSQGFLYPCLNNLISQWTPIYERAVIANFVYGGSPLGIAISMPLTGAISSSKMGWPAAFYLFGGLGLVWALVFAIFAENTPSTHKNISDEEKIYIESNNYITHNTTKKVPTPWKSIFTSLPFWAILVSGCAQCYGAFTLLTEIPGYMSNIMVGSNALTQSGFMVNIIDIAPNHAGTLFGIMNGTSNIFSILGPLAVGILGSDKRDPVLWRKVFLITAGIYIAAEIFYDIFTSGEVQPWNDIDEQKTEKSASPKNLIGVRHLQFALMFFTLLIFYGHRTSLSVAIIAMTEETPPDPSIPTYPQWDNTDTILSSFFWGYLIPPVGAGQLSEYFGPKWFLFVTMIVGSLFHILVPTMAASLGPTGVIVCRVIQGLNQGFLYPSIHNLISKWSPLYERSTTSSVVYGGSTLGIAVSMILTGVICEAKMGWPAAFYLYGGCGIAWAVIFVVFGSNMPSEHRGISQEEKSYIESSNPVNSEKKKISTPWKSIATSLPFWAILITSFGQFWGTFTLLTEIPSYMSEIMNFDIESNSLLSALPYFAMLIVSLMVGPIADKLISSRILKVGTTRKFFNGLGTLLPAITLFVLGFVDGTETNLATALLVVAVGTTGFLQSGSTVNIIDLAPNHAGTLLGICNGTSTIFSILAPLTVGFLGSDKVRT